MVILAGYVAIDFKIEVQQIKIVVVQQIKYSSLKYNLVDQIISRLLAYLMVIEVIYIRLLKSLFTFLCVNIMADDVDYENWKKKFKIQRMFTYLEKKNKPMQFFNLNRASL